MTPGPRNLITDVGGIRVGNAEDPAARSGVTVVLPDERAVAAVDVRGGAPGTHETDLLAPDCLVDRVDGICLAGGSAFGLEAAAGAVAWLAATGRGFAVGPARVPIVPAAILFDLLNGGDKAWGATPPYRALAMAACEGASEAFGLGNAGAGLGAQAGALKGGLGSASAVASDGSTVGALVAANPFGSVTVGGGPAFWAWAHEVAAEFGGHGPPAAEERALTSYDFHGLAAANTTIAVVATDAALDGGQARRLAIMAQDGIARAVRPAHTLFDGDTVFALSTAKRPLAQPAPAAVSELGMLAADCLARAIARGVYEAESLGEAPSYRQRFAAAFSST